MAIALKVRVLDLLFEFVADTFIFGLSLKTARTIAACALESLFDPGYNFTVFVKTNFSH